MRITVHIPDSLEKDIKRTSKNEGKSVSSLIAEATEFYLKEKKKKEIGKKVLEIAGKVKVAPDALEELHSEREKKTIGLDTGVFVKLLEGTHLLCPVLNVGKDKCISSAYCLSLFEAR